jgi:hypothetical protein
MGLFTLGISIAYQWYTGNKAKKAAQKEKDKNTGFEVEAYFESRPLSVIYGQQLVPSVVTWAQVSDDFVQTNIATVGKMLIDYKTPDTARDVWDLLYVARVPVGTYINWSGLLFCIDTTISSRSNAPSLSSYAAIDDLYRNSDPNKTYDDSVLKLPLGEIPSRLTVNIAPILGGVSDENGIFYTFNENTRDRSLFFSKSTTANVDWIHSTQNRSHSARKDDSPFLYQEIAICAGPVNRVVTAIVDGKPVNHEDFNYGQRLHVGYNKTATDPMILKNFPARTGKKFSNMTSGSCVFKLKPDDPQYGNGMVDVEWLVEGAPVKRLTYNNTDKFTLTDYTGYSNNPAEVLVDYMTNADYGMGLPVSSLDLKSFYKAHEVCEIDVPAIVVGGLLGHFYGTEDEDDEVSIQTQLYTCNISLDTSENCWDNVVKILDTMNDASLVWTPEGYKLHLDYHTSTAEAEEAVVAELTSLDILDTDWSFSVASQDDRLNQVTVRFDNLCLDGGQDSRTWPDRSSNQYKNYLAEDSGVILSREITLDGVIDPYHATHIAQFEVKNSRGSPTLTMSVRRRWLILEPGDIIRVTIGTERINGLFRVQEVEMSDEMTVQLTLKKYVVGHDSWPVLVDDLSVKGTRILFNAEKPSNVYVEEFTRSNAGISYATVNWDYNYNNKPTFNIWFSRTSVDKWTKAGSTQANSFVIPTPLGNDSYTFGVSTTHRGKQSVKVIAPFDASVIVAIPASREAIWVKNTALVRFNWTAPPGYPEPDSYHIIRRKIGSANNAPWTDITYLYNGAATTWVWDYGNLKPDEWNYKIGAKVAGSGGYSYTKATYV